MSVVILMSGGLDSTVMASLARRRNAVAGCVFIDWGQPAVTQERTAASGWCERNGAPLFERRVELEVSSMAIGAGEQGPRVVGFRNLTFVAVAAGIAKGVGAAKVWLGAIADDFDDYPDCSPQWIARASQLLRFEGVGLEAPLIHKSKDEVRELARLLGVNSRKVWSCYEPTDTGEPCGSCDSCNQ